MPKKKDDDLYALKRKMLKEARALRNKVIGNDEVDGSTFQRNYTEATKTKRALKIQFFGSKSKSSKYGDDTSIETFVYDFLNEKEIKFIPQKAIRFSNVDAYLPDYNTVIQLEGCYWHGCPKCYPQGPKNNIQRKNIEKDKVSSQHIKEAGHHLIEIWEHDIKERPDLVKEKLIEVLLSIKDKKEPEVISSADW